MLGSVSPSLQAGGFHSSSFKLKRVWSNKSNRLTSVPSPVTETYYLQPDVFVPRQIPGRRGVENPVGGGGLPRGNRNNFQIPPDVDKYKLTYLIKINISM